jgi:6-phosphogluconate dehydrogenase
MVHNGIEYGMMAAIGEGFEVLEKSEFDFDYEKVARVWNNGSVIRS